MLSKLSKLNQYQKQTLLKQAAETLASWNEVGNPEIEWDGCYHQCKLNNEDDTILILYKCNCGKLIAEMEEYGELAECECGKNYLGLDE